MKRRFLVLLAVLAIGAAPPDVPSSPYLWFGGGTIPPSVRDRFLRALPPEGKIAVVAEQDESLKPWGERATRVAPTAENVQAIHDAVGIWISTEKLDPQSAVAKAIGAASAAKKWIGGLPALPLAEGAVIVPGALITNRAESLFESLQLKPGTVGIGLDERTAIWMKGRELQVIGDSYALIVMSAGNRRPPFLRTLRNNSTADWLALRRAAIARSEPPFPADQVAAPSVEKGTLIIGGGGGMSLDIWKRFIELAGGPDSKIVVIPTAMEDPIADDPIECRILRKAGAKNLTVLHTRDRSEANKPEFSAPLLDAKAVWFSGGRQWRFVDSYEGTLTEQRFHEVLRRGGVIGGSSAGASIQSEYMPRGHPLGNFEMMAEGYERGFGFLPGCAVDQHFFARNRVEDLKRLIQKRPQLLGIGIDEGTAIEVSGKEMKVIGRSKIAVIHHTKDGLQMKEYPVGSRIDLISRHLLSP